MHVDYSRAKHIFIVCEKSDMRKGVDGLAAIIFAKYGMDVFDDAIFLFCGGRKDRFKALYFDRDGFLLLYKRLENGRLQWPRDENEVRELTSQQLRWLLEGLAVSQPKALKPAVKGRIA